MSTQQNWRKPIQSKEDNFKFEDSMTMQKEKNRQEENINKKEQRNFHLLMNSIKYIKKHIKAITDDTKVWILLKQSSQSSQVSPGNENKVYSTNELISYISIINPNEIFSYYLRPIDIFKFKSIQPFSYIKLLDLNRQFSKDTCEYFLIENNDVTEVYRSIERLNSEKADGFKEKIRKIEEVYEKSRDKIDFIIQADIDTALYGFVKPLFIKKEENLNEKLSETLILDAGLLDKENYMNIDMVSLNDMSILEKFENPNERKNQGEEGEWETITKKKKKGKSGQVLPQPQPQLQTIKRVNEKVNEEKKKIFSNNSKSDKEKSDEFDLIKHLDPKTKEKLKEERKEKEKEEMEKLEKMERIERDEMKKRKEEDNNDKGFVPVKSKKKK